MNHAASLSVALVESENLYLSLDGSCRRRITPPNRKMELHRRDNHNKFSGERIDLLSKLKDGSGEKSKVRQTKKEEKSNTLVDKGCVSKLSSK
ncbi:unnamed protein product [Arabis nemorensis]|uniref:Uncharacterized protein n=1 Tax=Arabis nemorensis TaxID=586526 RepID=A0A565AKT4_9BRAS|nr:unnamed protein product [Arabis nemorensis]